MIPKANESVIEITNLYEGYMQGTDPAEKLVEGLQNNGFANVARLKKAETNQTMLYFGAKTINNLPLLVEVAHPLNGNNNQARVLFKVPVLPLQPLLKDSLELILKRE